MERDQASKFINDLLKLMVSRTGSDLFITADFPPAIKVDGKVIKVSPQPLNADAHAGAGTRDHERQAGGGVRAHQRMQLRHRAAVHWPLPRQRLHSAGQGRHGAPNHSGRAAHHRQAGLAPDPEGRGLVQARPVHPGGRHRLGKIHLAGGHGRLAQRAHPGPHHHH